MLTYRGGGGGGLGVGVSCPGQLILPPPTWVLKKSYRANSTYFILFDCEDVSIIHIIQVKLGCF